MTLSATTIDEPIATSKSGVQPNNWYGVILARGGLDSLLIGEIYQKVAKLARWVLVIFCPPHYVRNILDVVSGLTGFT
jgi:hypothetical protein